MNPLAVLSHSRPRFAYTLNHCGHARSRRRASARRGESPLYTLRTAVVLWERCALNSQPREQTENFLGLIFARKRGKRQEEKRKIEKQKENKKKEQENKKGNEKKKTRKKNETHQKPIAQNPINFVRFSSRLFLLAHTAPKNECTTLMPSGLTPKCGCTSQGVAAKPTLMISRRSANRVTEPR